MSPFRGRLTGRTLGSEPRNIGSNPVPGTILCLLLALGTTYGAEKPKVDSTTMLASLYGGAWGLELAATEYALATNPNAYEANPLMGRRSMRIGAGVASTALFVVATKKLQTNGHPNSAKWLKRIVIIARIGLAIHDFRQASP